MNAAIPNSLIHPLQERHKDDLRDESRTVGHAGRSLLVHRAGQIAAKGGRVVREHGIGKIKKEWFGSQHVPGCLDLLGSVKQQLDPQGLWNPGNLLPICLHEPQGPKRTGKFQS